MNKVCAYLEYQGEPLTGKKIFRSGSQYFGFSFSLQCTNHLANSRHKMLLIGIGIGIGK